MKLVTGFLLLGLCCSSCFGEESLIKNAAVSDSKQDLSTSAGGHQTAWVPAPPPPESYAVGGHNYGHQAGPSSGIYNPYGYHSIQAAAHVAPQPIHAAVYKAAPVVYEAPKKLVHQHHEHQKVIHQHHIHQTILHEHHLHKVHLHNLHLQNQNLHEHHKHIEHVHVPVYHVHNKHKLVETEEHQTKATHGESHEHAHKFTESKSYAPPVYANSHKLYSAPPKVIAAYAPQPANVYYKSQPVIASNPWG